MAMKMIIAIIQPTKLRAVKEALAQISVGRVTICDSQEFAHADARVPIYRGIQIRADVLRRITLEIAVNDDFVDRTVDTILQAARTGVQAAERDGVIFVLPLDQAVQFDPESRGPGAI